jgi:outer membrane protein OmpA-like peptidoglycan-associated protein
MKLIYNSITAVLMCFVILANAQNSDSRLLIGIGTQGSNMSFQDTKSNYYKNWTVTPIPSQLKMFGYAGRGFSWGWQLSVGNAKRSDSADKMFFLQWGIDIKYSFANGYILKQKSWFDPYFLVGGGLDKWGNTRGSINVGAGLNLWFLKNVGVFVQTQYNYLPHKEIHPETNDPRPSFMQHSFGLVFRVGRGRDTDGDGVPDAEDKCPNDPGKPELQGCPDTDGDGIIDKDDKCPTVPGIIQFQGCPDTDGDGIPDADDACPTEKGTIEMKGCPDRDSDGIADKDDACPDVKGVASAKGCPDRDGDGVPDKDDKCPDDAGPAATNGCPDADGDGILDKDDKCPNVFGVAENHGCPQPALDVSTKTEVQKKLSFAAKNIFFESGRDVLKKSSTADLDSVAAILKQYDFLKVSIEGHTDNVGNDNANVELSNQRASAVMTYLISKGVTPTRLTALGYGPFRPIADNKTPEGRAQNRRVEINIKD